MTRLYASFWIDKHRQSIEIDNILGQKELKRLVDSKSLVHGKSYAKQEILDLCGYLGACLCDGVKAQFLCFDNLNDWTKRCV